MKKVILSPANIDTLKKAGGRNSVKPPPAVKSTPVTVEGQSIVRLQLPFSDILKTVLQVVIALLIVAFPLWAILALILAAQ